MGILSSQVNDMTRDHFLMIVRSYSSVFTPSDIARLWETQDMQFVYKKLHRYVQAGKLLSLRKGILVKDRWYDRLELATRIFTPSYVSLDTALASSDVRFLSNHPIFAVSYLSRRVTVDGQTYIFRRVRNSILDEPRGIANWGRHIRATPERAFLDILYLNGNYDYLYLGELDWEEMAAMLPLYGPGRRMEREFQRLRKHHS
jgi:hypothetical protein